MMIYIYTISVFNIINILLYILILIFVIKFINTNNYTIIKIGKFILHPLEIEDGIFIFSAILEKHNIRLIIFNENTSRSVYKYIYKLDIETHNLFNIKIHKYPAVHEKYYNILLEKPNNFISNTFFISKKKIVLFNNYKYNIKYDLLFCLTTLFNYNNSNRFIEFIEYYRNFGVDKFIIYNTNCSKEVIKIFNFYSKIGLMDIIYDNFTHNLYEKKRFHVWKQNDCFHRYKYYAKRIIFHDHDEIIYSPIYNNSKHLFANLNSHASIFHFYPKLTITNGKGFFNKGFYSVCPNNLWKFIINKSTCILQVVVHDVILSNRKCFKESIPIEEAYVLHARNTPPKGSLYCKNWTFQSNYVKEKKQLDYHTKLIYSSIFTG